MPLLTCAAAGCIIRVIQGVAAFGLRTSNPLLYWHLRRTVAPSEQIRCEKKGSPCLPT